jgi:hypothetical protein
MANLIREQKIIDSNKRTLIKYVIVSDGSQSSNTVLVNVSSLAFALNANGYIMQSGVHSKTKYNTTIKRIHGQVAASNAKIKLQWQGASNSEIVTFGAGSFDYDFQSMGDGATIPNPETSSNGHILISTANLSAGELATIFIDLKKSGEDYDQGQTADPYAFNRRPL